MWATSGTTSSGYPAPRVQAPYITGAVVGEGAQVVRTMPADATQYHLRVVPYNDDGPGIDMVGAPTASFPLLPPDIDAGNYVLLPDMLYSVQMRASDEAIALPAESSFWGDWGTSRFRTLPVTSDTIALLQPTAGEVVPSYLPTLGWSNSERSVFYYEIQMSKDPAFSPEEFLHNELVHGGVSMPRNTYRVPQAFPLEPASTYYWRVRPRIQGDGIPLPWTAAASFQTR